jgi:hypothetical protein
MPMISPDFSEAADFAPITPGTYKARVIECQTKESKKGATYLRWTMEVFGADESLKVNNRKFWYNTMVTGKGAGNLKSLLRAAMGEVPTQFDTDALLGKEVQVVLVQGRDQQGNPSDFPDVKSVSKLH